LAKYSPTRKILYYSSETTIGDLMHELRHFYQHKMRGFSNEVLSQLDKQTISQAFPKLTDEQLEQGIKWMKNNPSKNHYHNFLKAVDEIGAYTYMKNTKHGFGYTHDFLEQQLNIVRNDAIKIGGQYMDMFGSGAQRAALREGAQALTKTYKGTDIVGTKYNKILPIQTEVNREIVEKYYQMILDGQQLPPIPIVYVPELGKEILINGHNRLVAYMKAGVPLDNIPFKGPDMALYDPFLHKYTDWSNVKYVSGEAFARGMARMTMRAADIDKAVNKIAADLAPAHKTTLKKALYPMGAGDAQEILKRMGEMEAHRYEILLNTFRWANDEGMGILRHTLKQLFSKETDKVADRVLDKYAHLGMFESATFVGSPLPWGATDGKYLFRAVKRSFIPGDNPKAIFTEGFTARGQDMNKIRHIDGGTLNSYYIPASRSPEDALGFAQGDGYLFIIKNNGLAEDAAPTISKNFDGLSGYQGEFEMFFHGNIPGENVIGFVEIKGERMLKGAWR
jgi:hypothetical protein